MNERDYDVHMEMKREGGETKNAHLESIDLGESSKLKCVIVDVEIVRRFQFGWQWIIIAPRRIETQSILFRILA